MNTVRKDEKKTIEIIKLVGGEREIKLHPYQCACTLVKAGKVDRCPAHYLANFLRRLGTKSSGVSECLG